MTSKAASELVVELAKQFIDLLQDIGDSWQIGYYRLSITGSTGLAAASYVSNGAATMVDVVRNSTGLREMFVAGERLLRALEGSWGAEGVAAPDRQGQFFL